MKTKFEKSIDKAAILLNIPPEYDEYILFKIMLSNAGVFVNPKLGQMLI